MRSYILLSSLLLAAAAPLSAGAQPVMCPDYVIMCPDGHTEVKPDPNNNCKVPACPGSSSSSSEPVYCTQEAMLCPDGHTYVGRNSNNNCQFDPCPGSSSSAAACTNQQCGPEMGMMNWQCPDGSIGGPVCGRNQDNVCGWSVRQCPGSSSSSSSNACQPYQCTDGTQVPRCSANGTMINYFAAPCLTHGGEVGQESSRSVSAFADISVDSPYADAVAYLQSRGVVGGYSDGTFRPNALINRAEFAKIVIGAIEDPAMISLCLDDLHSNALLFNDVPHGAWFEAHVCYAIEAGIIGGYSDHTFRPAQNINFAEAAKILAVAFHLDVQTDSSVWYKGYVEALAAKNAIPTSIVSFDQKITRGEMAEMIFRLETNNNDKPSQTYDTLAAGSQTSANMMTVTVYLMGAENTDTGEVTYVPVQVQVPHSTATLAASLNALFTLHTSDSGCYNTDCSLATSLNLSNLHVTSATIVNGVAHVKIDGDVSLAGDLSGSYAVAQIQKTVMQFPTVTSADIQVNGKSLKCVADLSGMCQ